MEKDLLHILQHSLGFDENGQGKQYRNRFVTGPGSDDFQKCQALVEMGFMKDLGPCSLFWEHDGHIFVVTQAGIDAVAAERHGLTTP